MVRVSGSLGDSGFHRESAEDVQVKKESGEEASSEHGSTKTLLNETRSADRQSTGRNSVDGNEGDLETDLEDKPQLPPQVPSGTPVGLDESRDSLTKQTKAGSARYAFADSPIKLEPGSDQHEFSKTAQGAATPRRKMKGPDLEEGDKKGSASRRSNVALEFAYNRHELQKFIDRDPVLQILRPKQISMPKGPIVAPTISDNTLDLIKGLMNLLKEAGLVASPFDANELFDLDLKVIQSSIKTVIIGLKALVGEIPSYRHPTVPDPVSSPQIGSTRYQIALPYLSAAAPGSDGSSEPQRMSRRLPGAAMLESRSDKLRQERPRSRSRKPRPTPTDRTVRTTRSEESTSRFESYFQTAMSRFLKEQHQATAPSTAVKAIQYVESHDVEMKSTGSRDPDPSRWEYDPDEIDRPIPACAAVATTATGPPASSTIQQIRISAISDLKEFTGRDQDEDRARSWISKVKSALLRDRATDEEKCLTFADLLTGPAKNWYRQLSRSTRNKWSDLLRNFQIQYCGLGVSRIWQYYQSRKRPDESSLEYLYRLNVAALRARLKIKDGNPKTRREHVEHFIATLGNPDLADQLTLLRLADADDLEEVMRARERAKSRQSRSAFGSKYPQKVLTLAPTTSTKRPVYAVQIAARESESDTESGGSDSEGDLRQMYLASAYKKSYDTGGGPAASDQVRHDQIGYNPPQSNRQSSTQYDGSDRSSRCSHCGSRKHTDRDCWKRLTCQQCGKTGHPTDHCLFVCRGCGELHDMGRCLMEEFYSQIRRWYNPAKHAGMLPAVAEKMLKLGRSPGWNPVRAVRSRYCIYAFVDKSNADRLRRKADLRSNTCDQPTRTAAAIMSLQRSNEFSRSDAEVPIDLHSGESRGYWKQLRPEDWFKPANSEVTTKIVIPDRNLPRVSEHRRSGTVMSDLLPGESRGYWKHHSPGKWFRQAKITGEINNEKAILLLDTGAEVSIVDTAFARKFGCYIDTSQSQECVGIGENVYVTEGRTRIKITLGGSLVYFFDIWVGDLAGQDAMLSMDFMVPAGIRLDLADGSICLPEEIKIQLSGHRQLYNDKARSLRLDQHAQIGIGESIELPLRLKMSDREKLWVTRGDHWVPTVVNGPGRIRYVQITNISNKKLVLQRDERIGIWLAGDRVPRLPGFVSIGSRRYMEWQNLAFQATSDDIHAKQEIMPSLPGPAVDRPTYATPHAILQRGKDTRILRGPDDPPDSACRSDTVVANQVDPATEAIRSAKYISREADPEVIKPVVSIPDTSIVIPEVKVIDVADRQQDHQETRVTDPGPTAITGADATTDLVPAIRDTDDVLAKDENRVNADDNESLIDADRYDRLKPTMKREQEGSRSAEILDERKSTVPDRPQIALKEGEVDQPNFDEIWLPEDSWVPDRDASEHGVGKITDMRTGRRTRYGRSYRECLANWKGFDATDWIDETDLNCEALMHEFLRDRSYQKQFDMLQFREEE